MKQGSLFESFDRPALPKIYTYTNLNINRKINYKSSPMFLYGSKHCNTIEVVYRDSFEYGLSRKGLDYSLNRETIRTQSDAERNSAALRRAKRIES